MRVDATIGRTQKSVCAEWTVDLKEDDSAKPVVDVAVETDIDRDAVLAVDQTFRVSVLAQHRHRSVYDEESNEIGGEVNETSSAEAKELKLGFYLPP